MPLETKIPMCLGSTEVKVFNLYFYNFYLTFIHPG
uniref:Uncharacterized protein n=1 Tax=Anguilla anguilla TaxID=7936 RepID=A0A0E9V505_ANGAN